MLVSATDRFGSPLDNRVLQIIPTTQPVVENVENGPFDNAVYCDLGTRTFDDAWAESRKASEATEPVVREPKD
jgi:hypothetical protein